MAWYEQWFDRDEYELVYSNRDEEEARGLVDLIVDTIEPTQGTRILDVGCGRGRHAIEFAERGFRVTGLDLSERSLDIARRRAQEADLDIEFVHGDMREVHERSAFGLVVNLFTAFGYFEKEEGHQRAVDAMAAALTPDGVLVQDFMNAPHVRSNLVDRDSRHVGQARIVQERWISDDRINKEITLEQGDQTHSFLESVALLELADFRRFYQSAGLRIEHVFGDYDGSAYTETAPRLLIMSRLAEDAK